MISRRELIVGSAANYTLLWQPKCWGMIGNHSNAPFQVWRFWEGRSKQVRPTWLPNESSLAVVQVGFGRVEIPPGQHGRGLIVEVPPGDHGGGGIVCKPSQKSFTDDALYIVRCPNGIATFGGAGGLAISGKRLGWKLENVVIDRSLSGIEYPCVRPEGFSYFAMRNFEIRNVRGNGLTVPPIGTGIIDMENGKIHHCGSSGIYHPVYCNQQDKIRFQDVHVHSAEATDANNGAHLLKLYGNEVQVFGCTLEQAGPGVPTSGLGVNAHHSIFAPFDIGAYGQTTIAGNKIVRNSDYARNEIVGYRNRVWPEGFGGQFGLLPDLTKKPWKHLFAYNTVINSSIKPSQFALWNAGVYPGSTEGRPSYWMTRYSNWTNQDCIVYEYGNDWQGNPFPEIGEELPYGVTDPAQRCQVVSLAELPPMGG